MPDLGESVKVVVYVLNRKAVAVGNTCQLAVVVAVSLCPRRKEIEDRQDRKCGRDYSCENREFHLLFVLLLLPFCLV